jgi:type I restriction enzyme M protein
VKVLNPTKDDKVLDPSCGTAGFLVSTYKHILKQHDGNDDPKKKEKPLTPDERKTLMKNLQGYDIDPTMVRIAQVNMYLHQFKNPQIFQYDTLTSEERWGEKFDIILANPPFMSPKGGIKPHNKFSLSSNRAEVLFVDYIVNHLRPKGRAGIIVPEGIVFLSGNAYKALRKNLVENGLYAVVSLPGGIFQPYSGVKTSILFFDNELAKQKSDIAFIKISADGYDLGASKRETSQNDLPLALETLAGWIKGENVENRIVTFVSKKKIAENNDYNLSGERYEIKDNFIDSDWERCTLKEAITLNFGERITKKNNSGELYPVYGGGGESFRTDNFNRQNELIIARFAMGQECVRFVEGQFWLMDSGASYSINPGYSEKLSKNFVDDIFLNIQDEIFKCARGGAQKNLHLEMFYEIEIPLPPLEVQEKIVAEIQDRKERISEANRLVKVQELEIKAIVAKLWA